MNPLPFLSFMGYDITEIIALIVLIVIGLLILILVVKFIVMFIPAAIVALIVWFLTSSLFFAGIAFLVIAVLSIARKL